MATPTEAGFKAAYPAFNTVPAPLTTSVLNRALLRTDADTFGVLYEEAVYLRMADLLAKTPEGQKMRLVLSTGKSIYWADLQTIIRRVTVGIGRNA